MNEIVLALLKCPNIGNAKVYEYIVQNKFNIESMILNLKGFLGDEFDNFDSCLKNAKTEIERNKSAGINIITILNENFPSKLYTITDPVLYLYYIGNISLLNEPSVAVIGTRHPLDESKKNTEIIVKELSNKYVIVSGLALGIDAIGHKTTLEYSGKTIAVLPAGLNDIQPRSNKKLADDIVSNNGLLVSEYPVGTPFNTFNYAKRDRIQAALSDVIIVPEAKEDSGTMIAVRKAYKENKKVYQVNGNDNIEIKDTISLNDDYMKIIDEAVSTCITNEKKKKKQLLQSINTEQISLF